MSNKKSYIASFLVQLLHWTFQSFKVNENWLRRRLKNEYFLPFFVDISPGLNEIIILAESEICLQLHFHFSSTKKVEKVTSIKRGGRNENFNWINTFWRIWQRNTKRGDTQVPQTSRTVTNWFAVFIIEVNRFVIQVWQFKWLQKNWFWNQNSVIT